MCVRGLAPGLTDKQTFSSSAEESDGDGEVTWSLRFYSVLTSRRYRLGATLPMAKS